MKLLSVAAMRDVEAQAVATGVTADMLMSIAGGNAAAEALAYFRQRLEPRHWQRIVVVAGKGSNGGDALVAAHFFSCACGLPVQVYGVCDLAEFTGPSIPQAAQLKAAEVPFARIRDGRLPQEALRPGTVIIDGLLGTGFSGTLRPPYDTLIAQIRAANLPVIALDVPSGLDADSGAGAESAIQADLTVTMGYPKGGMVQPAALACCGLLRCVPIGLPAAVAAQADVLPGDEAFVAADAAALLATRRDASAHKNTFGQVLVIGGCAWYTGAPILVGASALRSGCGLVTVALPATIRPWLQAPLAALMLRPVADSATPGFWCDSALPELAALAAKARALVLGPGMGPGAETVVRQMLSQAAPVVLDADGLRALAQEPAALQARPAEAVTVLTPHAGEMRALLAGFNLAALADAARAEQAAALAQATGCWVVAKGPGTVVAAPDGRLSHNLSGTSGLATAGTGDVLAGILGGLLAQGLEPWNAVRLGVFLHGRAAELASRGDRALVADDLPALLGTAYRELTPFA